MSTIRVSLGEYDIIEDAAKLPNLPNILFWLTWVMCVLVTNIILMNFIIAEACAWYKIVSINLDQVIWKEKANLIVESESMTKEKNKTKQ